MTHISGISSALPVLFTVAKGTLPVLFDLTVYTIAQRSLSPKSSYAVASLVGAATLLAFYSSLEKEALGSGLLYLAYKTLLLVIKSKTEALPDGTTATPRAEEVRKEAAAEITGKFEALMADVTIRFDGSLNITPESTSSEILAELQKEQGFQTAELEKQIRGVWNSKTLECTQLIKAAAHEMMKLLLDVKFATQHIENPDDRNKAIADHLINNPLYAQYFFPASKRTLFHLYRYMRVMRYIIHCPNVKHPLMTETKNLYFSSTLTPDDIEPFTREGTAKNDCRMFYNQVIAAYEPIIPHLPDSCKKWFAKDTGSEFAILPK